MDFEQDPLPEFLATAFRNADATSYGKIYRNMSMMDRTQQRFQVLE